MTNLSSLTTGQLHRILAIKEQTEALQSQIQSIAGGGDVPTPATVEAPKKQRRMSRAGRAAIAAAARARWARIKGTSATESGSVKKEKRKLSAAHRRKLIKALAKARRVRLANLKGKKATPKPAKKDRRSSPATRAKLAAAAKAR